MQNFSYLLLAQILQFIDFDVLFLKVLQKLVLSLFWLRHLLLNNCYLFCNFNNLRLILRLDRFVLDCWFLWSLIRLLFYGLLNWVFILDCLVNLHLRYLWPKNITVSLDYFQWLHVLFLTLLPQINVIDIVQKFDELIRGSNPV